MKAYTYTADFIFAGAIEDYGFLPVNATYTKPSSDKVGFVQKWNGSKWEYIENHIGAYGYVNGEPCVIEQYGPFPEGWSETPPPPSDDELAAQVRAERDRLLSATDYLVMPDYPIEAAKIDAVKKYRQELRDITKQPGFPWLDRDVDDIPWPELPE